MANTKRYYVDYAGLSEFLSKLKDFYAKTSSTNNSTAVGYAAAAGTAATANALATGRNFSITGDVTADAVSFDGSGNVVLTTSIANATQSAKGLMSAADKTKLDKLQAIYSLGTNLSLDGNTLKVDLSNYATKSDISAVFKFKGTVAAVADLPTGASVGDVYHVIASHSEYVWVGANTSDTAHPAAHWEELGVTVSLDGYASESWVEGKLAGYRKTTDQIAISDITDFESTVKGIEVNSAASAKKTTGTLKIKEPGAESFTTYNGSADVSIDISSIATTESVEKKADKLAASTVGNILVASSTGNLENSGVNKSVLSNGAVADGNASFVTGDQVYDFVNPRINGLVDKAATYTFASGSNGKFTVTPTVGGTAQSAITVSTGADANKIEVINLKGSGATTASALTITNKAVTLDLSSYMVTSDIEPIPATGTNSIASLFA